MMYYLRIINISEFYILFRYAGIGGDVSDLTGGDTGDDGMGGDVMEDDGTGTDDDSVADMYAAAYRGVGTDPYIIADDDRLGELDTFGPLTGIDGMGGAAQRDLRGDEAVVADDHGTRVEDCHAEVQEGGAAEMGVEAIVEGDTGLYDHLLIIGAEDLPQQLLLPPGVRRSRTVVFPYEVTAVLHTIKWDFRDITDISFHSGDELHDFGWRHKFLF